ncbi:MAG: NAD(P)H-quinone oxidoreductase subunit N [Leptolyngbyaceae cyanobacterium SM1_4_3]|nr:NAD(P)H-quinone oxidoreductase subunit N [Leptolyngbyaceae cyanobacterium SM1_4_3]
MQPISLVIWTPTISSSRSHGRSTNDCGFWKRIFNIDSGKKLDQQELFIINILSSQESKVKVLVELGGDRQFS